jgi:uncharacterized protein (TIGR02145 family)
MVSVFNLTSGASWGVSFSYDTEVIDGTTFGRVQFDFPISHFISNPDAMYTGAYATAADYDAFDIDVQAIMGARNVKVDVPYIVLGEGGYYEADAEKIMRSSRATLFARAVDPDGLAEHPPEFPSSNTVRIDDAGGWNQLVTITPDSAGLDVQPFTTVFLEGGQDGQPYGHELARFEISLAAGYSVWSGHLHFSASFDWNYNHYTLTGVSQPITITSQDSLLVSGIIDPRDCIAGSIDVSPSSRKLSYRNYVPEYLRETPFADFVGSFEDVMNGMFAGSTVNDPEATQHGILDKIDGLLDLQDPDRIPARFLHNLAANMGYDMVSGILRSRDIEKAPHDLVRYARFLVSNLPEINRTKATKDSIRALLFSIGALSDIYYRWTTNYDSDAQRDWTESNENSMYEEGTNVEKSQVVGRDMGLTPHFRIDVDLSRLDLYSQTEGMADILGRALNTINALRPATTVLDDMALVLDVEHNAKQCPSFILGWGDGMLSMSDADHVSNTMTDSRDGLTYKIISINGLTWMAENFRGDFGVNAAYGYDSGNIPVYGRLYDYDSAAANAPVGWRLPTLAEIQQLAVDASNLSTNLLSADNYGADTLKFNFRLGGGFLFGAFSYLGSDGYIWTSNAGADNCTVLHVSTPASAIDTASVFNKSAWRASIRYVKI